MIYNEDCLTTLKRGLEYDYIITSPPDLDEIGFTTDAKGVTDYSNFLHERFKEFNPKNNVVTIINRDRKANGSVIRKHDYINIIMTELGWTLKTQKIWVRSYKANLYRFNYAFIQTYKRGKCTAVKEQSLPDAFFYEHKPIGEYVDNYPTEIVRAFINTFTPVGGTVLDPFMGSGSTAVAAVAEQRKYAGAEIVKQVWDICENRLTTQWDEKYDYQ
jgi:DNA modification methylase